MDKTRVTQRVTYPPDNYKILVVELESTVLCLLVWVDDPLVKLRNPIQTKQKLMLSIYI